MLIHSCHMAQSTGTKQHTEYERAHNMSLVMRKIVRFWGICERVWTQNQPA